MLLQEEQYLVVLLDLDHLVEFAVEDEALSLRSLNVLVSYAVDLPLLAKEHALEEDMQLVAQRQVEIFAFHPRHVLDPLLQLVPRDGLVLYLALSIVIHLLNLEWPLQRIEYFYLLRKALVELIQQIVVDVG